VKPTGVTAMTAGTGPGVTGTYSARYTWYDQTHDHESSPSTDATASLVLTNQTRTHTAPTGSPPSNVTHYRIYVRREDTSEAYWMRVATVIYGVPTYTEAVTDGTRVDPLPLNSANDPPTVNFAAMGVWKGFVVGFVEDGSDMHVSKQHDCESWNPKDIFKVSPGDGKGVRAVVSFGTYCVIMKPTRSFYLEGSRLPFEIRELSPDYGTVSVEATIAVGDYLYAWDEVKGPYRTNLNVWEGLADYRIDATLERVTNTRQIRVAHDEAHSLIVWSIGTEYVGRNRTLLAYHYGLETWLPPITGLEYGALTHYTPNNAASGLFCGDLWGRVHRLFETDRQSVPSGTVMTSVAALPTPPSTTQITGDSAAFYTTGAGLAGLPVAIQQADGSWVWHRIASNTATVLTLDTTYHPPLAATPAVGARIFVGGIDWYWWSPVLDGGAPGVRKRAGWFDLQWKPAGDETTTILPSHTIQVVLRFDEGEGPITSRTADFSAATGASLWNSAIWGTSVWSTVVRRQRKVRVGRAFRAVQVGFSNYEPDQATEITGYSIGCDWLRRRKALSASA
jgi:hypothetical protein